MDSGGDDDVTVPDGAPVSERFACVEADADRIQESARRQKDQGGQPEALHERLDRDKHEPPQCKIDRDPEPPAKPRQSSLASTPNRAVAQTAVVIPHAQAPVRCCVVKGV